MFGTSQIGGLWLFVAIAGAMLTALAVSRAIWWATRRNAFWAMGAGVLVTLAMFTLALLIGWMIARGTYGT